MHAQYTVLYCSLHLNPTCSEALVLSKYSSKYLNIWLQRIVKKHTHTWQDWSLLSFDTVYYLEDVRYMKHFRLGSTEIWVSHSPTTPTKIINTHCHYTIKGFVADLSHCKNKSIIFYSIREYYCTQLEILQFNQKNCKSNKLKAEDKSKTNLLLLPLTNMRK